MCGIAGFSGFDYPAERSAELVRSMCDAIEHRGPDDDGYLVANGVAMGMRRLSIIDVSGGKQPIYNEDRKISVVFNGEIYNHHVLREQLRSKGHSFRTSSDTEVLVHLYEEYGRDMVRRLKGMFAFAIWDEPNRKLFIARDQTGMKPLSYLEVDGGLVFCSELRSMLRFLDTTPEIHTPSVMSYLALGYVPDPASIFAGVRKLPPGHWLEWSEGQTVKTGRYWNAPLPGSEPTEEGALVEELRSLLNSSVKSHLESEVPLGAFLSGGLDSSAVVALMARHASGRVKTFSIGFDEAAFDESKVAKKVAAELGADHSELILRPDVEQTLDAIATMFDEPFGDSSAIPTFFVAQLARERVTVALSGDGGDELFGGYSRYRQSLGEVAYGSALGSLLATCGRFLPHAFPGRNRLIDSGRSNWGRYLAKVSSPLRIDEGGYARADRDGGNQYVHEQLHELVDSVAGTDLATGMMLIDLGSYLPGDILTKVDRTSMAVSLEARVPLLDVDLINFAFNLPSQFRVTRHNGKHLFRKAIAEFVPDWLFSRPKQGFAIPLADWFRGPLKHRISDLLTAGGAIGEYVDPTALERTVAEHSSGRRDHSLSLWRLIVLDAWLAGLANGALESPPTAPRLSY
ncbi:MAG: asparagine synthase (glutamine-hydrolyzing) [Gammaproteobacteria bacterium]|nr:asparagine synthase (glutamine-hydrolyzing) [Gammaproteobacteria bacterium]